MNSHSCSSAIDERTWTLYKNAYFYSACASSKLQKGAIISLWNPCGQPKTRRENIRKARFWKGALQRSKLTFVDVVGGNAEMTYWEHSVFVNCNFAQAVLWSTRIQQLAFYYTDKSGLYLINTEYNNQSVLLSSSLADRLVPLPPKTTINLAFASE
ncbi:DUF3293 domain-containing protein (plasmid) [Pseudoalteromonas sp. T1lg65]|uniref:DUF3293 domain-containing protein n=1 Tax=Pseudoalteromonas sp. T1lg65 TaxID=2077101 RepID=UPI003F7947AB